MVTDSESEEFDSTPNKRTVFSDSSQDTVQTRGEKRVFVAKKSFPRETVGDKLMYMKR